MQKRQFTLVELLVVIVIMMLLVAIAVPVYSRIMNGSAVGHAARMVSSQLNLARTEACARRKYVAVVFTDETMSYSTAANTPVIARRAFRSCYLKDEDQTFDEWVPGTKWEVLPAGAFLTIANGSSNVGSFADDAGYITSFTAKKVVTFAPTGKPIGTSSRPKITVTEGVVSANDKSTDGEIVKKKTDNKISCYVNLYTGAITTKQAE